MPALTHYLVSLVVPGALAFGGTSVVLPRLVPSPPPEVVVVVPPPAPLPSPRPRPPVVKPSPAEEATAQADVERARAVFAVARWTFDEVAVGQGDADCIVGHEKQLEAGIAKIESKVLSLKDFRSKIPGMASTELAVVLDVDGHADGYPWYTEDGPVCAGHRQAVIDFLSRFPRSSNPDAIRGDLPTDCNGHLALRRAITCYDATRKPLEGFQFESIRFLPGLSWTVHSEKGAYYRRVEMRIRGRFLVPGEQLDDFMKALEASGGELDAV